MKKSALIVVIIFSGLAFLAYSFNPFNNGREYFAKGQDTLQKYQDGNYSGLSRFIYTDEPYWGRVHITLQNDRVTGINFTIRDSALRETFDSTYEKHFKGNDLYIQQCRNDWKGVQTYPGKLIETQDIDKIDAISGATWSYNIFKASVKDAFIKAKKNPD
jgi:major membrane immunogen (membrane-anchored lipoprotein)